MRFEKVKTMMISKLKSELPSNLHYHGVHHTLDVLKMADEISTVEKISTLDKELLLTAVLFHDSGYITQAKGHEEIGCGVAKDLLPEFGFTSTEIQTICGLIMATKIPQTPNTHSEKIICDADLDYLGRDDYFTIAKSLFEEIRESSSLSEIEWIEIQVSFIEAHHYFTSTSVKKREPLKQLHLQQLKKMLSQNQN